MLKGLFVGIDRYTAEGVQWLTAAARDATALQALFLDTLGGEATLLTDGEATKDVIAGNLARLADCSPDDFVVVTFSGHGTQACELAPVDADPCSPGGLISADDLSGWLADIPARNVLVVLDCCFSGGHGAKVFQHGARRGDASGAAADFDLVAGSGRLLLMASAADQEAIEDVASGHSLLTSELLTALQGAPEVVSAGTVKVFRLLEFVAGRVADRAREAGRIQVPAIRGSLDGDVAWPVFVPGPAYRAAFPNRSGVTATGDPASLTGFGFPPALVAAWAGEIPSLNELQVAAINDFGVLRGENLLVSSPTSSGKTMVGELAALHGTFLGRRAMFLLPTKALVYDKKAQFERLYGAYGIRTVEATGETDDIGPLIRGRFDLALLTNEKFMAMAIAFPHVLDRIGTIVVDEVQLLADESRGWNLEFLLTLVRMHRKAGGTPQVVALSAVIGDTNGLERWLGGRLLRRHARPSRSTRVCSSATGRSGSWTAPTAARSGPGRWSTAWSAGDPAGIGSSRLSGAW